MMSMKETAVNKSSVTVSELAITGACIALTKATARQAG